MQTYPDGVPFPNLIRPLWLAMVTMFFSFTLAIAEQPQGQEMLPVPRDHSNLATDISKEATNDLVAKISKILDRGDLRDLDLIKKTFGVKNTEVSVEESGYDNHPIVHGIEVESSKNDIVKFHLSVASYPEPDKRNPYLKDFVAGLRVDIPANVCIDRHAFDPWFLEQANVKIGGRGPMDTSDTLRYWYSPKKVNDHFSMTLSFDNINSSGPCVYFLSLTQRLLPGEIQ